MLESSARLRQSSRISVNPDPCPMRVSVEHRDFPFIFYVVDWIPPEFGAVGQYAMMFAREMAQSGRDVCLVGLTRGAGETVQERCRGSLFEVKRVTAKPYDKVALVNRLVWSMRMNLKLIWTVVRDPRSQNAEILFTGSPPFMLFFIFAAKWLRGARLTYRITDFYPEVLIAAWGRRSLLMVLLEKAAWYLRRRVDAFEVLGEDQRQRLISGGVAPERITLKRDVPPVRCHGQEPAARPPELAGKLVMLYSGNYGIPHDVDTVIEGFVRHHCDVDRFGLWLNASGSGVGKVMAKLRMAGVPVAHTEPVPLEELPAVLASADVHLITLRPQFSGLVLPSKIYACLDSGRPILFVGPKSSDVHLLCTQRTTTGYYHVEPGDSMGFAHALDRLAEWIYDKQPLSETRKGTEAVSRLTR